jgi:hypothetical protein
MFAVGRARESPLLPRHQLVFAHQPRRAMPPDLMPFIDEITVHAWAAIGAVRQREGRPNMRQIDQVLPLAATGRTVLPSEKAALADTQNMAHPADRGEQSRATGSSGPANGLLCINEGELHRFPSLAKKAAAFFRMSRSCFRTTFSRRNRFSSACRSTGTSLGSAASRS